MAAIDHINALKDLLNAFQNLQIYQKFMGGENRGHKQEGAQRSNY
ncbi:hypothetical protein [Campylobacter jejuni]